MKHFVQRIFLCLSGLTAACGPGDTDAEDATGAVDEDACTPPGERAMIAGDVTFNLDFIPWSDTVELKTVEGSRVTVEQFDIGFLVANARLGDSVALEVLMTVEGEPLVATSYPDVALSCSEAGLAGEVQLVINNQWDAYLDRPVEITQTLVDLDGEEISVTFAGTLLP